MSYSNVGPGFTWLLLPTDSTPAVGASKDAVGEGRDQGNPDAPHCWRQPWFFNLRDWTPPPFHLPDRPDILTSGPICHP